MADGGRTDYIARRLVPHLPSKGGARILDLGGGDGFVAATLQRLIGACVTTVDVSLPCVRAARQRGVHEAVWGDVLAWCRLADQGSFDAVLLVDILEHLSVADGSALLRQVARVLHDQGVVVIHTPNPDAPFFSQPAFGDTSHETFWSRRELTPLLVRSGLGDVTVFEDGPVAHGFLSGVRALLWHPLRWLMILATAVELPLSEPYVMSRNYVAVARKGSSS